jgi:hypothetical protein
MGAEAPKDGASSKRQLYVQQLAENDLVFENSRFKIPGAKISHPIRSDDFQLHPLASFPGNAAPCPHADKSTSSPLQ